ncbi:MAG: ABC transporter ATP-binding protein [Chitinophagales bacterium]
MEKVIEVNNISKMYDLGLVGTGTLSRDLNRTVAKILNKPDPYETLAEINDREKKSISDLVWALKDVNFSVNKGEVIGIIGKNGAGKSTLLKILSRITSPTKGEIKLKGRVASLLEVGTGMHPEMTAKQNVYLNGAIMGMNKKEISQKFDEIIDFAGVGKYVDTPIKRFSSGMKVRLGFAVAAFMDPEILIIDEVLAVGDADFQKRAIGKMQEINNTEGRTVLFVSHNMEAVKNLCPTSILMEQGMIKSIGSTHQIIKNYLEQLPKGDLEIKWDYSFAPGNELVKALGISVTPIREDGKNILTVKSGVEINFAFYNLIDNQNINLSMHLNTSLGECVFATLTQIPPLQLRKGEHSAKCIIPPNLLNDNIYSVTIIVVKDGSKALFVFDNIISFKVEEERFISNWHGKFPGVVRPFLDFKIKQ